MYMPGDADMEFGANESRNSTISMRHRKEKYYDKDKIIVE
jgi:hypothetical protein